MKADVAFLEQINGAIIVLKALALTLPVDSPDAVILNAAANIASARAIVLLGLVEPDEPLLTLVESRPGMGEDTHA